ncbi:MAG: serine/threonine dehydratase [Pirellulaceae bacterium]|nr:MAG: serine/threonine dehydratase [Pirellulaceae bacterium]
MNWAQAIEPTEIIAAQQRIERFIFRTPLVPAEEWSDELGIELRFKAENLQHVGAFKSRGATNAVMALTAEEAIRGVVTHSSGNHAAALARAATLRGIPVHVVMPENSSAVKLAAVRAWGVDPVLCPPTPEDRQRVADEIARETGATLIHPFDNRQVVAGQGTVGLEIVEQWPQVQDIVVPVGGGGLLAGVLIAVKTRNPAVRVFGAEPAWADDAWRSLRSNRLESPTRLDTVADGLRTGLGQLTFPIIRSLVDDILLVTEEAIIPTATELLRRVRLLAEPSGAVATAAVCEHAERFAGRRVAVVISGGNTDPFAWHGR